MVQKTRQQPTEINIEAPGAEAPDLIAEALDEQAAAADPAAASLIPRDDAPPPSADAAADESDGQPGDDAGEAAAPVKKKRRPRRRKSKAASAEAGEDSAEPAPDAQPAAPEEEVAAEEPEPKPAPQKRTRESAKADAKPEAKSDSKPARSRAPAKPAASKTAAANPASTGKLQMLISYIPGEECRVAVVEDGKMEEFHAERAASISRVGNIYVGRVTNVEPAIQAAFVDFGVDQHGFLHVSDVHPRYFPGEDDETTESVGKKTPRRDRPPIQRCFRRGDEVLVQVLKEGVGTKGPTLTSYLSIPGRFLVMMPQMDKVGVSRKVEDEDQRREMRKILDQLELPEGFGFILRTAGMERTKMELKRDLAYLMRLWKDMEARRGTGSKPRLLYSESDLLVRALRDMLAPEIDEVIIDNELALARAARFLKIVAPRSKVRLLQFAGQTPLFHAFGIEQQIALMHAREVPLPGGGRLVIDETEALVAIDVNSGRMRDARDAETNAYRTNCEAVEEICRQLKLRDLGGIVINDLIDMRLASHRKDIEQRFRDRLKRDRARSTILPISNFGILEMTRQRMRGSHETVHFGDCPTCRGRGIVQKPDSVASDALRNLAATLDHQNVARVEMVVSPRVASELLSSRRKTLNKLERTSGKHVDVRVSETIPIDRITFYAYDAAGADIDVDALPRPRPPKDLKVWELPKSADDESETWATDLKDGEPVEEPDLTPSEQAELAEMPAHPIEMDDADFEKSGEAGENGEGGRKRRRRRRRRGGRNGDRPEDAQSAPAQHPGDEAREPRAPAPRPTPAPRPAAAPNAPAAASAPTEAQPSDGEHRADGETGEAGEGGRRRRRRRRRRRGGGQGEGTQGEGAQSDGAQTDRADEAADEDAAQPAALLDPDAPRGDSWDLPPGALPAIAPAPAIARQPAPAPARAPLAPAAATEAADQTEESDEANAASAPTSPQPATADGNEGSGEPGDRPQGRSRRRRRGRGGGQGGGQGGAQGAERNGDARSPEANPAAREPAPRNQPASQPANQNAKQPARQPDRPAPGKPPQPQREARIGGGYKKKTDQPAPTKPASAPKPGPASKPAPPTPRPAASKPLPPAAASPAPGSGQPAKPKRVLYSTRRRLSPAELAKRPKPE